LHCTATRFAVTRSLATRSIPVSCFPARPGQSCHNHTSENWSANVGSVRRYAAIKRSNFDPLSASDVDE